MTLTIIADDLTGACDTGCLFAGPAPVGVIAEPGLSRSDACAEPKGEAGAGAGGARLVCADAGELAGDHAGDADDQGSSQPQLRLVMTGMHWVVVPYWSPRENSYWNQLAEGERDTDRQRNDTNLSRSKRPVHLANAVEPDAVPGAAP